ncbi:hypothetical protein [Actinomadura parmotrematis]|uniref:Uncharacterized protein n=1 Tax=Actinomadura parmotrematis TaxID=2864039 RepID=A0ABS7FW03_9ACTN|nr:hypothetical protein [Actinomadura parmotrematis]MBW8484155.1 hypothetical protein [Actinomadura parmotrematis]
MPLSTELCRRIAFRPERPPALLGLVLYIVALLAGVWTFYAAMSLVD